MNFVQKLYDSLIENSENIAFCINEKIYSYADFHTYINGSIELLQNEIADENNPIVVLTYDCIETYAAIFAAWFTGNYFIPVNPNHPVERIHKIINDTNTKFVVNGSSQKTNIIEGDGIKLLSNSGLTFGKNFTPKKIRENQQMYVITTSGSSGTPKYVPINHGNVGAYCDGFLSYFPELDEKCRFLQTYDLTSDAAFTGYLLPLLVGACVYTVPSEGFKFLAIAKLIVNTAINWVKLTPSVLAYLTPYISKLELSHIEHLVFGGEALNIELLKPWETVFSNADFTNLYGPTETTISSTTYKFKNTHQAKSLEGVISIGKAFPEVLCELVDTDGNLIKGEATGELVIAGKQTMESYLGNDDKVFLSKEVDKTAYKFYRTGDMVYRDSESYLYFLGRIDDQVKIDGYRINLIEIENNLRSITSINNIAVVIHENKLQLKRLYAFLEGFDGIVDEVEKKMCAQLPKHMVPDQILSVPKFYHTSSGKIDKKKLIEVYLKKYINE